MDILQVFLLIKIQQTVHLRSVNLQIYTMYLFNYLTVFYQNDSFKKKHLNETIDYDPKLI